MKGIESKFYVNGGIGDLIQTLPGALQAGRIRVYTHFKGAADFYKPFNIDAEIIYYELANVHEIMPMIQTNGDVELKRELFISIPPVIESLNKATKALENVNKPIIGIHPIGSKFSNGFYYGKQPLKIMPLQFLKGLVSNPDFFYVIFGSKGELDDYHSIESENVLFVEHDNIWDSLAYVQFCEKIIAVDSAIKSYSVAIKKQSIVLVGDYYDNFRDQNFIIPYEREGVMKVFKFKEMNDQLLTEVKEYAGI